MGEVPWYWTISQLVPAHRTFARFLLHVPWCIPETNPFCLFTSSVFSSPVRWGLLDVVSAVPPASSSSSSSATSTASSWLQWSPPDPKSKHWMKVNHADLKASSWSQWSPPDLNCKRLIAVVPASTTKITKNLQRYTRYNARKNVRRYARYICQKECQRECQNICQKECLKRWQIECQNKCQIECQIECQSICQKECQILPDRMSE